MTEEQAIERITLAIASRMNANVHPDDAIAWARVAWNEMKAIAREDMATLPSETIAREAIAQLEQSNTVTVSTQTGGNPLDWPV